MTQTDLVFYTPQILDKPMPEIEEFLSQNNQKFIIDFKNADFITVDGLEWLEETLVRANSNNLQVSFANIPPSIYKVFKISRIENILETCGQPKQKFPNC